MSMVIGFSLALSVGAALGFLSGLGIGGGSLLTLWLTFIVGMDSFSARCCNLLFFIPCAICASFFRWRQGCLQLKKLLPPIMLGCITAAVFSLIGAKLDTQLLRKIFGGLLLLTGFRELFYKPKDVSASKNSDTPPK